MAATKCPNGSEHEWTSYTGEIHHVTGAPVIVCECVKCGKTLTLIHY